MQGTVQGSPLRSGVCRDVGSLHPGSGGLWPQGRCQGRALFLGPLQGAHPAPHLGTISSHRESTDGNFLGLPEVMRKLAQGRGVCLSWCLPGEATPHHSPSSRSPLGPLRSPPPRPPQALPRCPRTLRRLAGEGGKPDSSSRGSGTHSPPVPPPPKASAVIFPLCHLIAIRAGGFRKPAGHPPPAPGRLQVGRGMGPHLGGIAVWPPSLPLKSACATFSTEPSPCYLPAPPYQP